jgi:hypothetical protein
MLPCDNPVPVESSATASDPALACAKTNRCVRVAAYQAPLLESGSAEALGLIRKRVRWCEAEGIAILCCPEGILGGLADYSSDVVRTDQQRFASGKSQRGPGQSIEGL